MDDSKRLCTSVETFIEWIANGIPRWGAYCEFMSGHLIALDKHPGMLTVGVRETWRCLFAKIVLKVISTEATMACLDGHTCTRLKVAIDGTVHVVQAIWDKKLTT